MVIKMASGGISDKTVEYLVSEVEEEFLDASVKEKWCIAECENNSEQVIAPYPPGVVNLSDICSKENTIYAAMSGINGGIFQYANGS